MTEKIIKNGVDVSGCPDFDKHDEITCKLEKLKKGYPVKCTSCGSCNYKQLQREKEEYAEYVKYHHYNNDEFKQERDSLIKEIQYKNKYKQALEEIKEIGLSTLDCGEWIGQGDNKVEAILQKCEVLEDE